MCMVMSKYQYKMPALDSYISIENANGKDVRNVLCEHSVLDGDLCTTVTENAFSELVHQEKLTVVDLYLIDKYICSIENITSDMPLDIKIKLISEIISYTRKESVFSTTFCEHEKLICDISIKPHVIKTVSNCRYVEYVSEKYSSFPKWSFGIHSKDTNNTFLIGYLTLDTRYGFLTLCDCNHKMPCLVLKGSEVDIDGLIDTFVIIKDFRIVTEIFNEENVPCLECICVRFEDIVVLNSSAKHLVHCSPEKNFKYQTSFKLVRKSMVVFGRSKGSECWLQIEVTQNNINVINEQAFLILTQNYITYAVTFKEGHSYTLFHNDDLKETRHPELSRISKHIIYLLNERGAHFQIRQEPKIQQEVLSVTECKNYVLNNDSLVTFEGVLETKCFVDKLHSRVRKITDIYGYGTPTSKTHVLRFSYSDENDIRQNLDCFLSNWENIVMPLGLVNQMRVIVKNVVPQSSKYLKATALTSFEIVGYEPEVEFQTINLNEDDVFNWGPSCFLGLGGNIPKNVSIWGRVHQVQIISLELSSLCKKCSKQFDTMEMCMKCQTFDRFTEFSALLEVDDIYGESNVYVKKLTFLKLLLNLQEKEFSSFCKEIVNESYKFNISNGTSSNTPLAEAITAFLKVFNKSMNVWELKCRKSWDDPKPEDMKPFWVYLDGRRV
ncbi:unnamed protein product [Acanthoscelides obtectus]|nr:unnamed protein product [Acanthoscelides obtectus]CAK1625398.1 hypothetical protein AOBTE_LOCUS3140 [Acanthoscelides obtectus]